MSAEDFGRDVAFGRLVGVALPDEGDAARVAALVARLPPEDRAFAGTLAPARRTTWAGGRVALRAALADLGAAAPGPLLATLRGAPALPPGVTGSVAHKRTLAVALAARVDPRAPFSLGVDVELDRASRVDIAAHVLVAAERARVDALPSPEARAREVLVAFAVKEAIFKALDPTLARFIPFHEAELTRTPNGALTARFSPRAGEPAFALEVAEETLAGFIVVAARARQLPAGHLRKS